MGKTEEIKARVSRKKRNAKDCERIKDLADIYDGYFHPDEQSKDISRIRVNLDLINGRLDTKMYSDPICFNIEGQKIRFEDEAIPHNPIMSQAANSLLGQIYLRRFNPRVKHHGSGAINMKKLKWNELIRQSHQENIINPLKESIYQQYLIQNQIQDIRALTPEQLQQLNSDVNNRTNQQLPKDLLDFMFNEYETPTQKTAQVLLDYYVDKLDIHNKYIDSFIWPIAAGELALCVDDIHGMPTLEVWNPAHLTYGGGHSDNVWIQKMDWVRYESWGSYQYTTQKWAEELKKKDYDQLEDCLMPIYGNSVKTGKHDAMSREIIRIHNDGGWVTDKEYQNINDKTKHGQKKLREIYSRVLSRYGGEYQNYSDFGIREAKFFFRDKRKLKRVTRNEQGRKARYWMDEHYEPTHLDLEIKDVWVDEVQQCTKLGRGDDAIYVGFGAVPGQYKSIYNPWDVELPVYGRKFHTHMNMVGNISIMDPSKTDQMEYDMTMHELRRDMRSDLGTVFTFIMDYKPPNMDWKEWFSIIRTGKMIPLHLRKKGINGVDPQFMKQLNLSKAPDIANKLQLLNQFRSNIISNMHTNSVLVNGASPYATNENIRAAQSAGNTQVESIFDIHTRTFEKALNGLMERVKYLYNTEELNVDELLTESGITDLQLTEGFSWDALKIDFKLSRREEEAFEKMRAETLTLLQNSDDPEIVWNLLRAQTTDEVSNVFRKHTRQLQEKIQQQQQAILQQQQAKDQAEMAKLDKQLASKERIEQLKAKTSLTRTQLDVTKFERAADVDGNNVADRKEIEELKLIQKQQEHEDKMALEREKLNKNR